MSLESIGHIAEEINARCSSHQIGKLQAFRKELKGLTKIPTNHIFNRTTVFEDQNGDYAFHVGGRTELQFNIGFDSEGMLRHGVAFSFETNRTLPSIDPLKPKVERFNEFLMCYPQAFADLQMWHSSGDFRSSNNPPTPITDGLFRKGVFVFLGRLQLSDQINYDLILDDFDRLLFLYRFVEGKDAYPTVSETAGGFRFLRGCRVKPTATTSLITGRQLDVSLRHNRIQDALHKYLVSLHGDDAVGTESPSGTGGFVDVAVRSNGLLWFYEIKTALSARGCIREAIAQLLEYSFWPGATEPQRLIVVGEPVIDQGSRKFLERLRNSFSLSIEYQQFDFKEQRLVEFE